MTNWKLGIIGGSGLYSLDGLENVRTQSIETPWGVPSADLTLGTLNGVELVFLPRHGTGHVIPPSKVPYDANIAALKMAGCTDIIAISACGSLREEYAPGHFVVVDQYVDRSQGRPRSFFGEGCVAHVPMADPVCSRMSQLVFEAGEAAGIEITRGGTYLVMEGPQFSTRAESELYRSWGLDVIGMTNMPEAKFAREAELPYAAIAMVTDYDCWREGEESVDVAAVLEVMRGNTEKAKRLLTGLTEQLSAVERTPSPDGIETVLDAAIVTPPASRDPEFLARLEAIYPRLG
ncbi:MAG: S-methyl-5'-thioadenosine phosphorylase [Maricaulis sp.]|uniref:S-methyl-5'-thioadenosine phosphorylase n=1 Tax=Maricaulis sp. TaxID=1486257 RepID=UPI001B237815|nr:S-methyl-5'-thioadenosine phosphorylase [Maricaulis sp.]MBO6729534.1 S-methyl-5'-thioadenosine phosphorylase [Maricaulis sp.]MBO6847428.1 S-methyl-5'-thioadenosine phosphorylase [Maricaulis sp.]MBO6878248.1 S-methyl-5'-thioadenosine phosphorylase [Maricaulis sp.]